MSAAKYLGRVGVLGAGLVVATPSAVAFAQPDDGVGAVTHYPMTERHAGSPGWR